MVLLHGFTAWFYCMVLPCGTCTRIILIGVLPSARQLQILFAQMSR